MFYRKCSLKVDEPYIVQGLNNKVLSFDKYLWGYWFQKVSELACSLVSHKFTVKQPVAQIGKENK